MAERAYIVTKGVVLRETETKEADKILTLLTAERGKISVIARGVRRKSCKYAACAQQLAYSEWTLYQKGEWYYANEGATAELFNGLRTDLETLALGCYFAELAEAVTAPEVPAGALLSHLLNGLYALSALRKPPALVKPAFEIKLLCLAGYEPLADSCAYCGRPDPEQPLLDVVQGILRCRTCGAKESALSMPLCPDSLAALRHIVYGDPKRLYSFRLTGPALERLSAAAEAFVAARLEVDVEATRGWYDRYGDATGGCDCAYCRNYAAAVETLPPEVAAFLRPLGLDLHKPGDATEYGPAEGGRWYMPLWHIAGRLLEAGEGELPIAPGVTAGFATGMGPFLRDFPEPCCQCWLSMTLPWVLEEPADEATDDRDD